MKVDETEYDIDFATIDLDGHCTLRAILGKPLREAWQEVDWDDQKAAASFLNDPLVIKALTWLAMWQADPSVTVAQVGRLSFSAIEYALDPDEEAAPLPPVNEPAEPGGQDESASIGSGNGASGSATSSPVTLPEPSGSRL